MQIPEPPQFDNGVNRLTDYEVIREAARSDPLTKRALGFHQCKYRARSVRYNLSPAAARIWIYFERGERELVFLSRDRIYVAGVGIFVRIERTFPDNMANLE